MGPEAKIEDTVCKYAKRRGFYTRKFSSPAHRGVPDRLFISRTGGHVFFIEFKAPGKEPTALQLRELDEIRGRGGNAYWVDNALDGKKIIDSYDAL